ncbi:BNR Asp-box repeat domain protein [Fusarium beomiforme]|uniref:BNR Asp-box repeat domain protein n=1 Tax=Fusarium beomiforme TaxID=44412 RepID=A0A9P5AJP8_9HYPO|nr:BNR Asp-box repeat domain protein [Fusarium beomiforme]
MRFAAIVSLLLPLVAAKPAQKGKTFSNVEIFDPPSNYNDPQVLYARPLELSDGTLLATWENYSPEPPHVWFPIVKSKDGGKTWKEISKVKDTQNNWGLRYQPQLYELPQRFGKYPKGTVLISGSSIPTDLSETLIEVYASLDKGYTWEFVSHVALGGEAKPEHGLTPVWEPFLMTYKEKLILYYSDQRDNATHSQKLVHQTTTDLKKWSKVVEDTKYDDYYARPGMPTVAKLPNNEYIYTYEYGGGPNPPAGSTYWFPVFYRLSKDPQKFLNKPGQQIISTDGARPAGSPYVVWTPYGGKNGTIVVSCGTMSEIFTNQALGDASAWKKWSVPQPTAYTRALLTFKKDPDLLMIMGAGILPPAGGNNTVSASVVRLSEIMKV